MNAKSLDLIISEINADLQNLGNPDKAKIQKKYLKSPFRFYGVSRPQMQLIAKNIKKKQPEMNQTALKYLCEKLWCSEHHECKSIAIDLLNNFHHHVDNNLLPLFDNMINTATGWDHIDEISVRLIGRLLSQDPGNFDYLKQCEKSENFWKRRVSIIAQLKIFKTEYCDKELFFKICADHLDEKEFFIRKAIGWGLRELSKTDPVSVYNFILKYRDKMSGLTYREGSRRLPDKYASQLE